MMLELSYINAKSLLYIVDKFDMVDRTFAVIGSIAFSSVTIIVMRKSREKWIKIVFPVFDALLVFCGFNLRFADNLLGNPIAFYLTIFMAVFTGIITYSLGIINYLEHATANLQQDKNKCSNSDAMVQQLESALKHNEAELQQYKKRVEQIDAACKCEYCNRSFTSEAAKRSHIGKCPEKVAYNAKNIANNVNK